MRRSSGKYCSVAQLDLRQRVILVERVSLLSLREGVWLFNVSRQVGLHNLDQLLAVLVQKRRSGQTLAVIYPVSEPWSELKHIYIYIYNQYVCVVGSHFWGGMKFTSPNMRKLGHGWGILK